jgi:RNA polymerase sigma-70 factor (ECF subfamily)
MTASTPSNRVDRLAADRELAQRCAQGDAEAIRALEAEHFALVRGALARLGLAPDAVDETLQVLRVRLFVAAEGGTPAIASYDGRAKLSTWLHTVAVRLARRAARRRAPVVDRDEAIDSAIAPTSPELAYFRAQYRDFVDRAAREALGALSTRERHLLRCWATGMALDDIASFYRVHRSTASRWLQASRDAFEKGTRAALLVKTGMSERDYAHVMGAVLSDLVSVVADTLAEPEAAGIGGE